MLALSLSPAALGEVYKWVDTEGQVHYSDHQPPSVKNAEVLVIPADRLARRLKTIEDLAQRLVRLLNKEDRVSQEARELAQELAQQAEMEQAQQLDKIRELAWELSRQLQGEGDLIAETTRPTARQLLEEITAYAASASSQPDAAAEELARIRRLGKELETDRQAREAERAALEAQRRRESLENRYEEQKAPVKRDTDSDSCSSDSYWCYPRQPAHSCYLYPWLCGVSSPPTLSPPTPLPTPLPPRPPRPPRGPVQPPLDQRPPAPDLKQLPPELQRKQ